MRFVTFALLAILLSAPRAAATNYPIGLNPTNFITAQSMTGTVTGPTISYGGLDNVNIQCVWTGTPNGAFTVEVSLDATHWTDIGVTPAITATGSAGNFDLDLNQLASYYFHLIYTPTSSTGTLNCNAFGKKL